VNKERTGLMQYLVLIIVLGVIAFLLYKSVQDARERAAGTAPARPPAEPRAMPAPKPRSKPKPRPKPRQRKPKVDQEALAAHVAKLREAVDGDLISMDEAVASVVRQTDGALSEDAARKLLKDTPSG
jgi:hypothetical protein